MLRHYSYRAFLVVALCLMALPLARGAKNSTTALTANIFELVIDEQNTTAFYNNGNTFCSGLYNPVQTSLLTGDDRVLGPTSAYGFGSPWTLFTTGLSSTSYANNGSCGSNCLKVQFNSNNATFALDTRGTAGPRAFTLNFTEPCLTCAGPAGSPSVFGGSVTTPALLNVFLDFPFTSMSVCSSTTCPEAQPAFAKLWFTDPNDSSVTWRVDWSYLRVLRMSSNTWYFVGDECDGSQVAGLSKLTGNRTRPKTVFNGYYLIPFFYAAVQ